MVKTHFLFENLWISETSLGMLEKFKCSLALPNIKYNFVVLVLSQLYWLFIYLCFKRYFPIGHHCKTQSEFSHLLEQSRSACFSSTVNNQNIETNSSITRTCSYGIASKDPRYILWILVLQPMKSVGVHLLLLRWTLLAIIDKYDVPVSQWVWLYQAK